MHMQKSNRQEMANLSMISSLTKLDRNEFSVDEFQDLVLHHLI